MHLHISTRTERPFIADDVGPALVSVHVFKFQTLRAVDLSHYLLNGKIEVR